MKKILIISPSNKGTIALCTANIIKAIRKYSDYIVYTLAIYKEKDGIDVYNDGLFIVDRTSNERNNISYLMKIYRVFLIKKNVNPDISISTLLSASSINVLTGIHEKKIGIFHAPLAQTKNVSKINYILCTLSYRFLFTHLDYLYAVSKTTKDDVEKNTGCSTKLVYNIHDFQTINARAEESLSDKDKTIFQKKVVLYVGHLYDTKGVKRLIKAFSLVKTDCNLVLVGANTIGEIPDIYRNLAEELNVGEKTFFMGYQNNPYKYIKHCSVFVLPSYSEGLPGVLIEALFLNKRVITTNSSVGDWEIMQCDESYKEILPSPYENDLGIIVSNDDNNKESILQLSSSIDKILKEKHVKTKLPFDKERFEGHNLVKFYTLNFDKMYNI